MEKSNSNSKFPKGTILFIIAVCSGVVSLYFASSLGYTASSWSVYIEETELHPNATTPINMKMKTTFGNGYVRNSTDLLEKWVDDELIIHTFLTKIQNRFRYRTVDSCVNECVPGDVLCKTKTYEDWLSINLKGKISPLELYQPGDELFPWEKDFLSQGPLTDFKLLPDPLKSVIRQVSSDGRNTSSKAITCRLNETLTFLLDLYDGYGKQRKMGMDEIRVWMTSIYQKNSKVTYRTVGSVVDQNNGSYTIKIKCLVVGNIQLNVGVIYPREYMRLSVEHLRMGSYQLLLGLYKRGLIAEATPCFSLPNVPGRPCLCNHTLQNGPSFYCGKPYDKGLNCSDLMFTRQLHNPILKNFTDAESRMTGIMSRRVVKTLVPHKMRIVVTRDPNSNQDVYQPSRKCDKSLLAETWSNNYPHGLFNQNNKWMSLVCKERAFTKAEAQKCLFNTTILMIGDSNMLRLHNVLTSFTSCRSNYSDHLWAQYNVCANKNINSVIHFKSQEYPLYLHDRWNVLHFYGGLTNNIHLVPSQGRHIVLFHTYLHASTSHESYLFQKLTLTKNAMIRILRKNPNVLIAIRGPHVSTLEWADHHMFGGDVLGAFSLAILKHIFRDLKNRILFLDGWESTTAIENVKFHPPDYIPGAMINTLLSFFCS